MRVVHLITGLNGGGAEAILYRLCINDKIHQHFVISMMGKGVYGSLLKSEGIEVYCLNLSAGKISLTTVWELYKLIRQLKPEVIQTWMYHADLIGGLIGRLVGIKNIFWGVHHAYLDPRLSKKSTSFIAKINSFLSFFIPKKIVYCSNHSRVENEKIGFRASAGVVVFNSVDLKKFTPSCDAVSQANKKAALLSVGRFDPYKDYENLLCALSIISSDLYSVDIYGEKIDSNNVQLVELIKKHSLEDRVNLNGFSADIHSAFSKFDVFVLSSKSESFGNVLIEAMACGLPCVTTDVGAAEFIVGETGWVVPPKDPQALANAIMQALEEKQANHQAWLLRKEACRNRIVENFSIEKMIDGYHQLWSSK